MELIISYYGLVENSVIVREVFAPYQIIRWTSFLVLQKCKFKLHQIWTKLKHFQFGKKVY